MGRVPLIAPADKGAGRDSFRAVPGVRDLAPCKGKAEATPLTWCRCGPVPADLVDSATFGLSLQALLSDAIQYQRWPALAHVSVSLCVVRVTAKNQDGHQTK